MLKHTYFMTVIGSVFCLRCACDKLMQNLFQRLHLIGVGLWVVITLWRT